MDFSKTIEQLVRDKQFIDAREIALQWTEEHPKEPKAWFKLGNIYAQQKDPEGALAAYEQSVSLNAADPAACFKLAVGRFRSRNFSGAAQAFAMCETAAKGAGESAEQYVGVSIVSIAQCLLKENDAKGAKKAIGRAGEEDSSNLLGTTQTKRDVEQEIERALAAAKAAKKAAP